MNMQRAIDEADLHAYVDGLLDNERSHAVMIYLAEHPQEERRVNDYRHLNALLRQSFEPVLDEPVPPALNAAASQRPRTGRWQIAAAIGWIALGSMIGWLGKTATEAELPVVVVEQKLVAPALAAHAVYTPEVLHPVEVAAEQEQHLAGWLSKRLGAPIRAPGLSALGYGLIGGRLLPDDDGPAAQFMYEARDGSRLTLYVRRADWEDARETAFRYAEQDGIGQFYWINGRLGYALIGRRPRQQLLEMAELVYHQLNP